MLSAFKMIVFVVVARTVRTALTLPFLPALYVAWFPPDGAQTA
jgi:hypothetical protein